MTKHKILFTLTLLVITVLVISLLAVVYSCQVRTSRYKIEIITIANASNVLQSYWHMNEQWPNPKYIHDDSYLIFQFQEETKYIIYTYQTGLNETTVKFHLYEDGQLEIQVE